MAHQVNLVIGATLCALACLAQDFRPPFDKSDYVGRVGIQLNPWFPPKKPPMHYSGGPNVPYLHHEGDEQQVWRQAMDLCAKYGVDVLVPEINEPQAWNWNWRVLLRAAAMTNDPPVKVGMFFGMYSKDKDAVIASMKKVLGPFRVGEALPPLSPDFLPAIDIKWAGREFRPGPFLFPHVHGPYSPPAFPVAGK